ncbi:hypothetical protein HK096_011659, partial [Nowakowskiella sp. JEL0078]
MVAKKMPEDVMGEDIRYTHPHHKPIPLSILTTTETGPRRDQSGRLLEHTLLGDCEYFDEMNNNFRDPCTLETDSNSGQECKKNLEEIIKIEESNILMKKIVTERKRENADRKRWLNQLHIFQRYREVRE